MLEDDAAGVGHVQHRAGRVRAFAGDDDGGRGLADVVVDQLQQLLEVVGVSGGGVEEQHPGGPGVVVDAAGAGRGHVGVVSLRPVDRGHRGGEDLRGRGRPGRSGRVVGDPLVHGDGLLGHADAVDLDAARPRVDGQLRGEVAGEVAAVGGVAADGERGRAPRSSAATSRRCRSCRWWPAAGRAARRCRCRGRGPRTAVSVLTCQWVWSGLPTQGAGTAAGALRCSVSLPCASSTAASGGIVVPCAPTAAARRRRASSANSTVAAAAAPVAFRVISTGASSGGGAAIARPGGRFR